MSAADATEAVKRLVDEVSGYPVHVEADPSLRTLATVNMARGPLPAHIIRVNAAGGFNDYIVAYQCGFIFRVYRLPPADRFDTTANYRGRKETERLVTEHFRKLGQQIPSTARQAVAEQIYSGLIIQLRSGASRPSR